MVCPHLCRMRECIHTYEKVPYCSSFIGDDPRSVYRSVLGGDGIREGSMTNPRRYIHEFCFNVF